MKILEDAVDSQNRNSFVRMSGTAMQLCSAHHLDMKKIRAAGRLIFFIVINRG